MSLPRLYADPALYDLVHDDGTEDEAWLLERLCALHGVRGRTALEPACGSGRYLEALLERGWTVAGYDLSPKMAAFARKRLARWGGRANVSRGDMRRFRAAGRFDLVFNLLSTFRHLMNDRDALAHLRRCRQALAPGGMFVLGLDLAVYGEDQPDEEVWVARRGGREWRHVLLTEPPDARRRRERIMNFIHLPDGRMLESHYELRSYDARELSALLARARLRVEGCYGPDGRKAELGGPERALWLALRAAR